MVVTRPTKYGNPYRIGDPHPVHGGRMTTHDDLVDAYRWWIRTVLARNPAFLDPLRGHDLACYCKPPRACHVDVLLELANEDRPGACAGTEQR